MLQTNLAVSIRATSIKGDEYPNLNQSTASALFFFFFFWESKERWERCSEKLIDLCLLRAEGDTTSCSGRHRGGRLYYSTSQAPPTENCRWKHPFNLTCLFVCNLMWVVREHEFWANRQILCNKNQRQGLEFPSWTALLSQLQQQTPYKRPRPCLCYTPPCQDYLSIQENIYTYLSVIESIIVQSLSWCADKLKSFHTSQPICMPMVYSRWVMSIV